MIEFGGITYYIDMIAFDKAITPVGFKPTDKIVSTETKITKDGAGGIITIEEFETSSLRGKEIDAAKFEIIRTMLEIVLDYDYDGDDMDTSLGVERALDKTSLSFKLAFNTLVNYGIIKEKE